MSRFKLTPARLLANELKAALPNTLIAVGKNTQHENLQIEIVIVDIRLTGHVILDLALTPDATRACARISSRVSSGYLTPRHPTMHGGAYTLADILSLIHTKIKKHMRHHGPFRRNHKADLLVGRAYKCIGVGSNPDFRPWMQGYMRQTLVDLKSFDGLNDQSRNWFIEKILPLQ